MIFSKSKRNTKLDDTITFPALQCWNPMTETVTIAAQVNGERVSCRISGKVLNERFPDSSQVPMESTIENRTLIEAAARRLIQNNQFDQDGSITINIKDI
jgi:Protein of unknown function (DUF1488).